MLNPARAGFARSIVDEEGATGKTFGGVLRYLAAHKPRIVLLENVVGLKGSNLQECMRLLHDHGYAMSVREINSVDLGVPQSRPRLWFFGVLKEWLEDMSIKPHEVMAEYDTFMRCCSLNHPARHLDEFLLDESHPSCVRSSSGSAQSCIGSRQPWRCRRSHTAGAASG